VGPRKFNFETQPPPIAWATRQISETMTNTQSSVDSNSTLAQGMRSSAISFTQMKLSDVVSMPVSVKALSDRINITVGDAFDAMKAFGEGASKASYTCAKAGTNCE
jgi:hypothetical protein